MCWVENVKVLRSLERDTLTDKRIHKHFQSVHTNQCCFCEWWKRVHYIRICVCCSFRVSSLWSTATIVSAHKKLPKSCRRWLVRHAQTSQYSYPFVLGLYTQCAFTLHSVNLPVWFKKNKNQRASSLHYSHMWLSFASLFTHFTNVKVII